MKIGWDDMQTVLAVVRGGTLAAAASELGVNHTTVARRIARAEAGLGVGLFERLADGYQPTAAARLIADKAKPMQVAADDALRALQGRDQSLSGPLTLTAPQLLIVHALGPVIDRFCALYPDVTLHVRATNDLLDLTRREADLALRVSRDPGDSLTGLRLASQHSASFASPACAARLRADPQAMVDWLVYADLNAVPKAVDPAWPAHRVRLTLDDMVAIVGAARAGLGVARMPMFLGRATDGLVQVPVLPPQPYADIWVVAHRDVWTSAKVTAFRDLLVPHFHKTRADYVA